jgi:putative FmdB family regulatory protein
MPLFHYECDDCKTQFDVQVPFGTKELPPCVNCGSKKVRKLIRPPRVHFKGTGFYKTDSRPASSAPAAKPAETKPAEPAKKESPAPAPAKPAEKKD